eukprot:m.48504 g.48504  ORF g.48504 m.48504 type:complete len:70 (+) comp13291_c0_seq8:710-919(+)
MIQQEAWIDCKVSPYGRGQKSQYNEALQAGIPGNSPAHRMLPCLLEARSCANGNGNHIRLQLVDLTVWS